MSNKYSKKKRRFKRFFMLPFCLIILFISISACGDSNSNNSKTTSNSNNWDELVWDQGNWG